jgi:hypothetical protein
MIAQSALCEKPFLHRPGQHFFVPLVARFRVCTQAQQSAERSPAFVVEPCVESALILEHGPISPNADRRIMSFNTPQRALAALILITLMIRVGWAGLIEPGNDEAYNYVYTIYPDLSYFDHPPMTMWTSTLGMLICGDTVNFLSLRLIYLLLFAGSTWVMYRLTSRWYGAWAGFYAALALNLAPYYTGAAGAFALPDGPFLFFLLLAIWALSEALIGELGRVRPWLWVGLAWGCALLTKYHAIFLPAGALLYIVLTPAAWRVLRTPGPYLATALGLAAFTPVLIWNHEHAWASFAFQGNRALEWQFRPAGPALVVVGTLALLAPWIWLPLVRSAVDRLRGPESDDVGRLLLCLAVVPLVFFLVISCGRAILVHWPLMGFLPMFCLLGKHWAALAEKNPKWLRKYILATSIISFGIALTVLAQARFGLISFPDKDPCREFSGWESVGDQLRNRGLIGGEDRFLFTTSWDDSGHLAFAVRNRMPVVCYNNGHARGFAFWSRPEDWLGKDGLFITLDNKQWEPGEFEPYFQHIELLAEFPMTRAGTPFRNVRVFRCTNQKMPYPFNVPR